MTFEYKPDNLYMTENRNDLFPSRVVSLNQDYGNVWKRKSRWLLRVFRFNIFVKLGVLGVMINEAFPEGAALSRL